MQVQQQPGARPGPGQQQEQEEAAGGGQAAGGQRHLHHHRHRHQVSCDWRTRGHAPRCLPLIGPQLPERLLRAAVGQPPEGVGRGAVGGDPGARAGAGRHQPQAQGQVPDVWWGKRLGEFSVEIYSMQINKSNSKHPSVPVCVQYFWSSDGPVGDLSQKSHKKLQLERGILRGGRTYNFSVVVLSSQVEHCSQKIRANNCQISFQANLTGTGWTLVTVESLGPQAVLSANKVK